MPPINTFGYASTYDYYLSLLGTWPTNLAMASQWFLQFTGITDINVLSSNFSNLLNTYENSAGWSYDPSTSYSLLSQTFQYTGNIGCAWAREVDLPGENINASHEGLDYGGYQAPATSNTRTKYKPLSITMLETNASFIDLILRPWAISVGYNGLVARDKGSEKYVKCGQLDVIMLAKTGYGSPMAPRKVYSFSNVAPITIPPESYSYMEDGLRTSPIEFVYDSYWVSDASTGSLIKTL
jgi:hypothetical protein